MPFRPAPSSIRPALPQARITAALAVAVLLAACGGDGASKADADTTGDDVHHLVGPGCEAPVRYHSAVATGVGGAARARVGMRHVPLAGDGFEASLCSDFCHAAGRCGDDFGGRAACLEHCAGLIADGRAKGVACYASDCRERARCLEGAPVEELAGCPEVCATVASCPGMAVLGLTPELAGCRTTCAGRAAVFPGFADALTCIAKAGAKCDVDAALDCLPHGRPFCPSVCLEVGSCPASSPLAAVWSTPEACFAECDARPPVMALKAQACVERLGCDADRACLDEVSPTCEAYFTEAATACPATTSWPASFGLLAATCDPTLFSSMTATDEVAACLTARGSCDALEERICASVNVAALADRCAGICSAMCDCGLMVVDDCLALCTAASNPDPELDTLEACVASDACDTLTTCADAVLAGSALAKPPEGDDPCARYCQAAVACGGDAAALGCATTCAARLDAGDAGPLAALGCYEADGCAAFATCAAAPPTSAACQAACDAAPTACAHVLAGFDAGLAACSAYCAGLVTTWGSDTPAAAACVTAATPPTCVLPADAACAPR